MTTTPRCIAAGLLGTALAAQQVVPTPAPRELGAVSFARDLDLVLAGRPARPVFLLFQEIPG